MELTHSWNLYAHLLEMEDWSDASYKLIANLKRVEEFWDTFYYELSEFRFLSNFIFLFKDGIRPKWEDTKNVGQYSMIINNNAYNNFSLLAMGILGGDLFKNEEDGEKINGISISYDKRKRKYKANIYVNEQIANIDEVVNRSAYLGGRKFKFYWKSFNNK